MIKWCEITDAPGSTRFRFLDEELKRAGLETEFSSAVANESSLPEVLEHALQTQNQIRVSGRLSSSVLAQLPRLPSSILSLKACDSLVCDKGEWWPRFFLVEGLNQTIAMDASALDLTGSVLILGASAEARAAVAALSRIGFNKMIVSSPRENEGEAFVEDLRRSYFGIKFQVVARNAVTQLPGVCSIAVNTLSRLEDAESISELAYFNFLKPNGFWLDLTLSPRNASLESEALSVGAAVVSGAKAIALTDKLWAESVFKTSIDLDSYAARLAEM
jgi:shikimate 5-dehydrogenase